MASYNYFYIKLWLIVFIYTILIGLLIQLLILPLFFPYSHAGDGLLTGGDWLYFQSIALNLVADMEVYGWNAWQLRPLDQGPAGIAAAIYYLTGIAKPWVLLPLNALCHASSAVLLILIIGNVCEWEKPLTLSVLPFAFFPTSLLWNAQYHKESFFILGSLLVLFSLLLFLKDHTQAQLRHLLVSMLIFVLGIILIWVVRPYGVEMVFFIGLVFAVYITVILVFRIKDDKKVLINICFLWIAFSIAYLFTGEGVHHRFVKVEYSQISESYSLHVKDNENIDYVVGEEPYWYPSSFLPGVVDENLYKMSVMRERFVNHKPDAGTSVDINVNFNSAKDIIKYVPRALQIGLLAPFPKYWLGEGASEATTIMRRFSVPEMLVTYVALFGLISGFWLWRKNLLYYMTTGFSLGMILSFAMVVNNVGTLHRMRYGFLMVLVALGISALLNILENRNSPDSK